MVERHDFGRDRTVDDSADFGNDFKELTARFVDEGGVGRDAIDESGRGKIGNFTSVRGVDKEFHDLTFWMGTMAARGGATQLVVAQLAAVADQGKAWRLLAGSRASRLIRIAARFDWRNRLSRSTVSPGA